MIKFKRNIDDWEESRKKELQKITKEERREGKK